MNISASAVHGSAIPSFSRRRFATALASLPLISCATIASNTGVTRPSIMEFGAVADGTSLNTTAIQAAINHAAQRGGGTVTVPAGVFVSGALFLKPGVHLHLERGAVLRCSNNLQDFPLQRTRIEGHFEERFNPGLINADRCDGLHITGEGTLDGAGMPVWELFWSLHAAARDKRNFRNLSVPRARLAVIENSRGVVVDGVTFKDSQFWNLHLYRCQDVLVRNARFLVPDNYNQAPSTDGIDIDSSQRVTVDGCYFSITDDCIAAKGSKGPHALDDRDSPPVEHIRVRNCVFKRGYGVMTLGSEATLVRDVVVEHCTVHAVDVGVFKLRTDTPQYYEDIHFRHLTLVSPQGRGALVVVRPWTQYTDLQGAAPPQSLVRNISFSNITGEFGGLGSIRPNPGQTEIGDFRFTDIDVRLARGASLPAPDRARLAFVNVRVNGKPYPA